MGLKRNHEAIDDSEESEYEKEFSDMPPEDVPEEKPIDYGSVEKG